MDAPIAVVNSLNIPMPYSAELEDEVIPLSKEAKSWALWKQQMERWVFDIKGWNPKEPDEELIAEEL